MEHVMCSGPACWSAILKSVWFLDKIITFGVHKLYSVMLIDREWFVSDTYNITQTLFQKGQHFAATCQKQLCRLPTAVSILKWTYRPVASHFVISFRVRWPPRWPSGKASASRAEDPGFESRLRRDFFGVESYQWLENWHSSGYPARRLAL